MFYLQIMQCPQWDSLATTCLFTEPTENLISSVYRLVAYFTTVKKFNESIIKSEKQLLVKYSQTYVMWPSKGTVKYGHIRQVAT
jgi:hypothetical protein